MSGEWESTILLRVADQAFVRSEPLGDGREAQELIACRQCRRSTDWLIAVVDGQVEFACRCGHGWQILTGLPRVVALAEHQPVDPRWQSLDDVRRALGFTERRRGIGAKRSRNNRRRQPSSAAVAGTAAAPDPGDSSLPTMTSTSQQSEEVTEAA
jgi:hypothetical protein